MKRFLLISCSVLLIALLCLLIYIASTSTGYYDPWLFQLTSLSVAKGNGWSLFNYPSTLVPSVENTEGLFNPEIASGPLHIYLMALLTKIIGPNLLLGNYVTLLSSITCVGLIARKLYIYKIKSRRICIARLIPLYFILFTSFLALASDNNSINIPVLGKYFVYGYVDGTSSLLSILALLYLIEPFLNLKFYDINIINRFVVRKNIFSFFLFSWLSVSLKPLPIIVLAPAIFVYSLLRKSTSRIPLKILYSIISVFLLLLPNILFVLYKRVKITNLCGSECLGKFIDRDNQFFIEQGSGLANIELPTLPSLLSQLNDFLISLVGLPGLHDINIILFSILIAFTTCMVYFMLSVSRKTNLLISTEARLILYFPLLCSLLWVLLFKNSPWYRHYLFAFNALFIVLFLESYLANKKTITIFLACLIAIKLSLAFSRFDIEYSFYSKLDSDRKETASFISRLQNQKNYILVGCGWNSNNDIYYLNNLYEKPRYECNHLKNVNGHEESRFIDIETSIPIPNKSFLSECRDKVNPIFSNSSFKIRVCDINENL